MRDAALLKAIKAAGGTAALAKGMNLTSQAVSQWERVPAERVLEVERLTKISRYELRPDIFGDSNDGGERAAGQGDGEAAA